MNKLLIFLFILIFNFVSYSQIDRSKKPEPGPAPEINIGKYESFELSNGLKVFVVQNKKLPFVSFSLIIDRDPIMEGNSTGYISAAGSLLRTGTKNRTKDQLDEEIDFIGASFSTSSTGMFGSSLKKHTPKLLEIMSDVLLNPDFKQEELDKIKTRSISNLRSSVEQPSAIASRVFNKLLYGEEHPYSQYQTEESVNNIKLEECVEYFNNYFIPNSSYLAIVGDITLKEAKELTEKYFSQWKKGEKKKHEYKTPELPLVTKVAVVDRPNSVQSTIRVGHPAVLKIGDQDGIKAQVMNTILGGGVFRLYENLREKRAFTYGAYSSLSSDKLIGNFSVFTDVRNEVTDSSLTEIFNELKRIRNEAVPQDELNVAKNYLSGNFALSLEGDERIAQFAVNIERYGLPKDYYDNYLKNVSAVSVEDVQSMAKKYIKPEQSYVLVVGNTSEFADKIKKFTLGKIEYYDVWGEKYDPSSKAVPEGLTVEKVIENYINAMGGKEKLLSVEDRTTEMEGKIQNFDIKYIGYQKAPNKLLQIVSAMGFEQKILFDGEKGFQITPMGEEEITGETLETLSYESRFDFIINYSEFNVTASLTGIETINGKDAYRVEFVSSSGAKWQNYFDVESGLKIREQKNITTPQGVFTQVNDLSDYREVEGIKYPFKIKQTVGPQMIELNVISLKINSGIEDVVFKK